MNNSHDGVSLKRYDGASKPVSGFTKNMHGGETLSRNGVEVSIYKYGSVYHVLAGNDRPDRCRLINRATRRDIATRMAADYCDKQTKPV